ncbi:hypothetical protein Dimus_018256, partial [Dionaea muscipula]
MNRTSQPFMANLLPSTHDGIMASRDGRLQKWGKKKMRMAGPCLQLQNMSWTCLLCGCMGLDFGDQGNVRQTFSSHVAHALWNGLDRGILTLQNRYDRLSRWSIDNEAVLRVLRLSGLYHLTD